METVSDTLLYHILILCNYGGGGADADDDGDGIMMMMMLMISGSLRRLVCFGTFSRDLPTTSLLIACQRNCSLVCQSHVLLI